jgi:hypothetical protein
VRKLAPYIRDAEAAAKQVRGVCLDNGKEIRQMNLVRAFNGVAAGAPRRQIVAAIPLCYTPTPEEIEQERVEAAAKKQAEVDAIVITMERGSARPIPVKKPLQFQPKRRRFGI